MKNILLIFLTIGVVHGGFTQNLFRAELDLPVKGISQRNTYRLQVPANETVTVFDEEGPASILHWWFTYYPRPDRKPDNLPLDLVHFIKIKVYYDGHQEPDIDLTMAQFFSILQQKDVYPIDNAAIKVLPLSALNCYFPMPFEKCRIEIENTWEEEISIWLMVDWQEYPDWNLTPYRLKVVYNSESPAPAMGSILMADLSGEGFLAGMTKSVVRKDFTDNWYHTGGDHVLMDGESNPRAMRGIGGEDVFNMSFGVWEIQNEWVGTLVKNSEPYERAMYRIFGPSPIWFDHSLILRFGTKANDIETVVYAYVDESKSKEINTPTTWNLVGPFECNTYADFDKEEWPEKPMESWPAQLTAGFGVYNSTLNIIPKGPTTFEFPIEVKSEHGWCDFSSSFRGRQKTNIGAQAGEVSAYASANIEVEKAGTYQLKLGYDDWIKVWVNGELIHEGRHDKGIDMDIINVNLKASGNKVLVKLSNFDNEQWRVWSFVLRVEE